MDFDFTSHLALVADKFNIVYEDVYPPDDSIKKEFMTGWCHDRSCAEREVAKFLEEFPYSGTALYWRVLPEFNCETYHRRYHGLWRGYFRFAYE